MPRLTGRRKRILVSVLAGVMVLLGAITIGGYVLVHRLQSNVARVGGTFDGIPESERPTKAPASVGGTTFLMVGSDSRDDVPTTGSKAKGNAMAAGDHRTDTIMMVHIPPDRHSISVISIPRDSWVDIPGRGKNKVNAAYAFGGPALLIRTLEQLTNVRIDHFAVIDFYGFKSIIDAIGGIDLDVPSDTTGRTVNTHLDGSAALTYVRERHSLPQGDLDRVKRQQNLIRVVMAKVSTVDPTSNPVQAYKLLDAGTSAISFDSQFSDSDMRSLAFGLRGMQSGGVNFMTAPVTGTGMEGTQSIVRLNQAQCAELWKSINNETISDYIASHKSELLPAVTR
jgi:LCP family protein required for cell wall assembly